MRGALDGDGAMSERDHTVIEELLSVDALGGLDDADRATLDRERAAHGALRRVPALEARLPRGGRPARVLARPGRRRRGHGRRILAAAPIASRPGPHATRPADDDLAERRARARRLAGVVAVAAAFVLFVGVVALGPAIDHRRAEAAPAQRSSASPASRRHARDGVRARRARRRVLGSGLPDPGPGKVYEIWMIEGRPARLGRMREPHGRGHRAHVDASIGTTDTMAVTAEPADCPAAPTSPPVLLADLTTVA